MSGYPQIVRFLKKLVLNGEFQLSQASFPNVSLTNWNLSQLIALYFHILPSTLHPLPLNLKTFQEMLMYLLPLLG